jgi:isopentenyl phosphate kinase
LFSYLADHLHPGKLLLAGVAPGVYEDYPSNQILIPKITPQNRAHLQSILQGSASNDVTGGMLQKVDDMLSLVKKHPDLEAVIFSGEESDNLYNVITGSQVGTAISHV